MTVKSPKSPAAKTSRSASSTGTKRVQAYRQRSAVLLDIVRNKMHMENMELKDLAATVGVSYAHAVALQSGERDWAGCERSIVEKLAKFLGASVLEVYFWSGFLQQGDAKLSDRLEDRIESFWLLMKNDRFFTGILPSDEVWNKSHPQMKYALVEFYTLLQHHIMTSQAKKMNLAPPTFNSNVDNMAELASKLKRSRK